MATSAFLGANPLTSLKPTSLTPFSRLRSLPTNPLQVTTTASFKTRQLYLFSSPKYDNLKLKCSSSEENNHFASEEQASQDPLGTIANEILSNVLEGFKTPSVENPNPLEAIFCETLSSALEGFKTPAVVDNPKNPLEGFFNETLSSALKVLKTPAMAAMLLGVLLTSFQPNSAWAASGGRVGGSSFSSRRSSSSSSSRSSSSSSSSSRRHSSSSSSPSYSYKSYSSHYSTPSSSSSTTSSASSPMFEAEANDQLITILVILFLIIVAWKMLDLDSVTAATSNFVNRLVPSSNVVKLQVGLLGSARALQKDLDRIAETADTSTPKGLSYILTEATVALLRHPDYWFSSYSSVTPNYSMEDAEKCFNKTSIEERAKFDEETLVNVNNKRRKASRRKMDDEIRNEYIVVTLLVAIEGKHKLPATVNSSDDLKEALKNLGSIPPQNILAAEVLWTPQEENDTLSEEELIEDYPLLKQF